MNETDKLAEIDRKLDMILASEIDGKLTQILSSLNEVLAWAACQGLMNTPDPMEQIDRTLGEIVSALTELLAVAPRSNAAWYQQQTQSGQRELPTL
jgi:hypothetical protein